jgi:hypothetical protein
MGGDDAGVSQGGKTSVPTVEFVTNSRRGGLDGGVKALAKKGEDGGAGGGMGGVEGGGRGGGGGRAGGGGAVGGGAKSQVAGVTDEELLALKRHWGKS